jgi:hypothetical protein
MSETIHTRPTPKRPPTGLAAWQATIGYISDVYHPDAALVLRAYSHQNTILWTAEALWSMAEQGANVVDCASAPQALADLWLRLEQRYPKLLQTLEAHSRKPKDYADHQWMEPPIDAAFERLMTVTAQVFHDEWLLSVYYQPIQTADTRVHAELRVDAHRVQIAGQGADYESALRDLYRRAAKDYADFKR